MSVYGLPLAVLTDSYKACHYRLYPKATEMVAYAEFRQPFGKDREDSRLVYYGIRYIIEHYVAIKWTVEMVEQADKFYATHNAGKTKFPFPKDLILKFIKENNGYFPCKIESLPEGSVAYPHLPVYQITTSDDYAPLCTWLETLLTMVWYPSTVATLSRRSKDLIREAFVKSVDDDAFGLLDSRLHDFGFRGCTCLEQSVIGGCAHLLNFNGTDTLSAAFYVQFVLNGGNPEAISKMIEEFGSGVFACVMDSYDYVFALEKVLPSIASYKLEKGGFMVLRPDSGDPIETVLQALRAADKVFGSTTNSKGFKILRGCSVIQGDGVNYQTISKILDAALKERYSAQNIAFGMGGGLLQKVNRDTMSFATKLSHIRFADGKERDIMKTPKTDTGKNSLPGTLSVIVNDDGLPVVVPKESIGNRKVCMETVYDHGKIKEWDNFTTVRNRLEEQWKKYPKHFNVIGDELKAKVGSVRTAQDLRMKEMFKEFN